MLASVPIVVQMEFKFYRKRITRNQKQQQQEN
jgi:hypothetical protein